MSKGGPGGNGSQSNRKNFKNMFYSPKNGREAYTEPHSKMISQVQTKEHSPVHRYPPEPSQNQILISQQQNSSANTASNTIQGHHSKLRMSKNSGIQQLKQSTNGLYGSKDSGSKMTKVMIDNSGYEVLIGNNSSF